MSLLFISGCTTKEVEKTVSLNKFTPDDPELYNTIVQMDSMFFDAYNNCDLDKQAEIYSDSIEFFHDQGGLMTSKQELLDGTEKNICGKVSRELVQGSIEVYPIKGYGAIEIGFHKFHNNQEEAGTPSKIGRFVIVWKAKNDTWEITKVMSLH
jgi:ketosteroid isomerase-like protein